MIKPNRVGEIPLIEPDVTPYAPAQALLDLATAGNYPTVNCLTRDVTLRDEYNSDSFVIDGLTLTNQAYHQAFALGVLVSGSDLIRAANDQPIMLTINGNCTWGIDSTQIIKVAPIIGRYTAAPVATTTGGQIDPTAITKFTTIPALGGSDALLQGGCSVSKTVCLGNWSETATLTDKALFAGFLIHMSLGANTLIYLQASMSIHKYLATIDTFDPEK